VPSSTEYVSVYIPFNGCTSVPRNFWKGDLHCSNLITLGPVLSSLDARTGGGPPPPILWELTSVSRSSKNIIEAIAEFFDLAGLLKMRFYDLLEPPGTTGFEFKYISTLQLV